MPSCMYVISYIILFYDSDSEIKNSESVWETLTAALLFECSQSDTANCSCTIPSKFYCTKPLSLLFSSLTHARTLNHIPPTLLSTQPKHDSSESLIQRGFKHIDSFRVTMNQMLANDAHERNVLGSELHQFCFLERFQRAQLATIFQVQLYGKFFLVRQRLNF